MALPAWPYIFATILPLWLFGVYAVGQSSYAHDMCDQVGFPQPRNQPFNEFYWLFLNKEAVFGLIMGSLGLAGEWKAVGIVLACCCVGGFGDLNLSMTVGRMGFWEAVQAHGLVSGIGAWAAVRLIREN